MAALATLAAAAQAATPGHNGSIVFMRFAGAHEDDHTAQLFVRTPSGAERQITHVSGGAFDPAWSPDGSRIVFERWDSRHRLPDQLYTVNADGSALHALATGCSKATQCLADDVPAWSPDGTQIVFVRYFLPFVKVHGEDLPSAADLMLVPAAGGAPQVLRHFAGDPLPGHPAWSPDGRQLVLPLSTATQPSKQSVTLDALNVLDIASGSLRAITPLSLGASDPDWSPDGRRIVFSSEGGHSQFAYVVRPTGPACASSPTRHATTARARATRASWTGGRCGRAGPPTVARSCSSATRAPAAAGTINGCPRGPDRTGGVRHEPRRQRRAPPDPRRASGVVAQLGARSLTHPTRREIKDMRRTATIVALTLAGALAVGTASASATPASNVTCGQTLTRSVRLANDLRNCPGDGLVIGARGITVDLNGDLGIEAVPGVTDGGGNRARHNGNVAQCTGVACG